MFTFRRTWKWQRLVMVVALIALLAMLVQMPVLANELRGMGADSPGGATTAHGVTNIRLDPPTPNILSFNQNVNLTFDYHTTEAGGVLIFARPMSGGALTPNYAAHPSPQYPVGAGSGTGFFTITSGAVVVDHIRFQMWNMTQTTLLYEALIPVYYRFESPANMVRNIRLDPPTPNILGLDQRVNITFDYTADQANVLIFARPMSGGALSPNYAAHPSPQYPVGAGSGTGFFTITSGAVVVDQVRFEIWNTAQTTRLYEALIPVYYRFESPANMVRNIRLDPPTPNLLNYDQRVNITFDYTADQANVLIFARPMSGGALSPNYAAHPSPQYPVGTGSGDGFFTITSGSVTVDKIRFTIVNTAQTVTLYEATIPVYYQYGVTYRVLLPIVMTP